MAQQQAHNHADEEVIKVRVQLPRLFGLPKFSKKVKVKTRNNNNTGKYNIYR